MDKGFLKAGHAPTLLAAFLYFDVSFMVWVLLGPLGISIAHDLHLNAGQKGLLVATPVLAGAGLRVIAGALVDVFGPRRVAIAAQVSVIFGLWLTWLLAPHGFVAQIRGRDSLFESCLLAGFHEQAATHALPNDELVLLQRSAEEAWLSDGVV